MIRTSTLPPMMKLASDPRSIVEVEKFVDKIAQRYRLNEDQIGNILISLTEAVNNAIIHGNRQDRSKKVLVRFRANRKRIAIQVSDEGRGFDYRKVPDPTKGDQLHCCGGRGVFLMQNLSDSIAFRNGGRTVEMQFAI